MEKQKTRSEIAEKYKWDLTRIYKSDQDWYNDYEVLDNKSKDIKKYEENLFDNSKNLESYLKLSEELDRLENKLSSYTSLRESEDATNTKYQQMSSLLSDLSIKINSYESFFDEAFFKTDYKKIEDMLDENEFLASYKKYFERKNRYRDHYLSKEKEELVSELLKPMYTAGNIYSMLTDAEIKYGKIKDEEGKEVELTDSNYSRFITSKNQKVRKDAFNMMYETLSNYKNTLTLTYTGDIDATIALNRIYNFKSSRESSLYGDNIDLSVYDNLIKSVHNNLDKLFKYFKDKKEILKLDKIHLYDLYVKVANDTDKKYSYEDAIEIVLKALEPLGEDYIKKAREIFDNRLVDVYNNVGKRGGAFSSGTYDTDPYILLNYEEKLRDVSTIAHELGHSMHTKYSKENNKRQYSDYTIFVAEVASTVNELLLANYMLKTSDDDNEKMSLLNELLDNYKATIYRQTMFAEFEREMYNRREKKEPLTNDMISDYYYQLNKEYFGDDVVVDDNIRYEWMRIPHFYNAFYVYKYATSMAASTYIADKILSGDLEFRDKYINFLSMGSREFPIDELKTLGIDMNSSEVIDNALKKFEQLEEEFVTLYNKK